MNVKRTTVAAISLTDCVSTLQEVIIADVNLDTNYKKTAKSRAKVKKNHMQCALIDFYCNIMDAWSGYQRYSCIHEE